MDANITKGWPGLTKYDAYWCQRRLPKPVCDLLKDDTVRLTLAGGFIRSCIANEPVNDIDLFSSSREVALLSAEKLAAGTKVYKTQNAYTVNIPHAPPVQFIHRWAFARPEDVVPSFDYTIARVAMWWEPTGRMWRSLCDPNFYADLASKRLVYCSPARNEDAGGSILRALKFYQRGYRTPLDSLGSVIARLFMGVRLADIESGDGREASFARVVTGLLREVDPSIDPSHLAHFPGSDDTEDSPVEVDPNAERQTNV